MYVRTRIRNRLAGLGIAPVITTAGTGFVKGIVSRVFGSGPPEKPFPWRFDRPGHEEGYTGKDSPPGMFGIVFGTQHRWFRVWLGSVDDVFGVPRFDISGTIDGGKRKWRAKVTGNSLVLTEDFGRGAVRTNTAMMADLKHWTQWSPSVARPVTTRPTYTVPAAEAGVVGTGSSAIPVLVVAGLLGMMFLFKR